MGLARASAASGDDSYAKAAGEGFAALGAGRLEEARAAFTRARSLRPDGVEALQGLRRGTAATRERGLAAAPARGAGRRARGRGGAGRERYTAARRHGRPPLLSQQ